MERGKPLAREKPLARGKPVVCFLLLVSPGPIILVLLNQKNDLCTCCVGSLLAVTVLRDRQLAKCGS